MYDKNKAHYLVATAAVVKGGKFLILKRSDKEIAFPGKWTVPGGKLEQSDYKKREADTPSGQWYDICEHLVKREVMEEAGLKIKDVGYLTSLVFERPDGIPVVVIALFAHHDEGEVKLGKDITDHAWVTLEEARDYDLIDGIYEELEMLDKHLRGEKIGEWKSLD